MESKKKTSLNIRRRWPSFLFALFSSGIIGGLLWASPFGHRLETHFGLELAFWLRGPRPAPVETAYVPISHASAVELGQESIYDLDNWDRSLFARLVERLSASGVSAIVFDVLFVKARSEADRVFSQERKAPSAARFW